MKNNLLDTNTANLNEILGNGKIYRVPLYQRDYSWEEENWEDLWEDVVEARMASFPHYMGAIVLQDNNDKTFTIIDGQQRLSTLSILAIACIHQIQQLIERGIAINQNKERVELLMRQYIGTKNPASLNYSSKLFLNENNNSFYQAHILQAKAPINYRRLQDSDKLLWDAFQYFNQKVAILFADTASGQAIATFLTDVVAEKLVFIQIVVDDELSAYTVFETLNSRGVSLTSTDLLKNYLLSKVAASTADLNIAKTQWKKIIDTIGLNEFPTFLRHYINSYDSIVTKDKLFKRIKKTITNEEVVFQLLDELEGSAYLYQALRKPADEFWDDYRNTHTARYIRELNLFKVTQYKSLAIAAFKKFSKEEFIKVLKICAIISFRYSVIGRLNANDLEKAYNKSANKIMKGLIRNARELFQDLKSVYVVDETFKNSFSTKVINTKSSKKLVRYILVHIENHLAQKNIDEEETSATVEHILSESFNVDNWGEQFSEEEHFNLYNRLGNHTLLEPKLNKLAADKNFQEKKDIYLQSQYKMTNTITQSEWNPEILKRRQERLAKWATAVWKVDY